MELLKQKNNGEIKITFSEISNQSGYSRMHLNRLIKEVEKKDIDNLLVHGLTGKNSNNSAPAKRLNILRILKINIQLLVYHSLWIFIMKMLFGIKKSKTM